LFAELPTLGVRQSRLVRTVLARRPEKVATRWGLVDGKVATLPDGTERFSPEYESCRRIAQENSVPLAEVRREALAAYNAVR
jgi:uncharacterized protein (DUF111 family)